MKMKRVLAAMAFFCLSAGLAADIVRNGSFETFGGNGVPAEWNFRLNNNAPVTVSPATPGIEGEKSLRIVSRLAEKRPNVFGVLTQIVKLKPDTDYTLTFMARGQEVNHVSWAIGKGWTIRHTVTGVTNEWAEHTFSFRVPADRMEGADNCGLRLIVEGRCTELDLDDVRIVPRSKDAVGNGSFEGKPGEIPKGWSFRVSGNAQATATVDNSAASAGRSSLRLVNRTPRNANVYGALSQTVRLFPGIDYVMRVRAKGEGSRVNIAVGVKWLHRLDITAPGPEWRDYELQFRLNADEVDKNSNAPLVIITENITPGVWLDELSITPREAWNLPPAAWQENRVTLVGPLRQKFDTIRKIPKGTPTLKLPLSAENAAGATPEVKDFSAETALLFDADGLVFLADVTDDIARPGHGATMWKNDSLQLRIDRAALRRPAAAESDLEIGFSVDGSGKVRNWCWDAGDEPHAGKELPPELVRAHGFRTAGGYFLAAHLSWRLLGDLHKTGKFGFSIVANDSDAPAHRNVCFLTPGVHDAKYSDRYMQALLDAGEPVFWAAVPPTPSSKELTGTLLLSGTAGDVRFSVEFTDAAGKKTLRDIATVPGVVPGELVRLPFSLSIDALAKGNYTAEFRINGESAGKITCVKADLYSRQLEAVNTLCGELERLKAACDGIQSEYLDVPLDILGRHLPRLQKRLAEAATDDEKKYYAEQAAMTRQDITDALADLKKRLKQLRSGGKLPEARKFHSGTVTLENGWPVATVADESGKAFRQPVVFTGYGHFTDIDRDIAFFQKQGANVVQIEIGPRALFPREGKTTEFEPDFTIVDSRLLPLLKKAHENNVKIALLISPHYHPEWLLKKYPELVSSAGFLKYEVTHPKARQMLQAYIAALLGRLKTSPHADALHSICLANEPVYTGCTPGNPYSAAEFGKYMERKYGPVAKFNEITNLNFNNYHEVAEAAFRNAPVACYEFYTFARETFAGWHRMLAEAVKKAWPEMPVHTKIMVFSSPFEYVAGVDPELMAEFSDYNGNDNYFYRRGPYIADWNVTAMTHEMQISAKPVSIANTENHIVPDRETRPVSNDHIYTALFQQFVTGASTLVTWVWVDFDYSAARQNPRSDFAGNIRLRPGNLVAHALAGLDGMRLAPELRKFFDYKPEAAILYSPTSLIFAPDTYRREVDALYTQLCFTGYRVRFLSERQLARGESGGVKLLFAVGAKNITREAFDGLKRFAASGGRIARDAESLTHDQYNNPLPVLPDTEKAATFTPEQLLAQLHRHIAPLPVSLAGNREGIFFRAVPDGKGNWLVNLVNYNFEPRPVRLEGNGSWTDLIGERPFHPRFTLAPLKPQLLRFTPAE